MKEKAMRENLLSFEDLENLKLAEDLAKTCFEMYDVTSTGLAPEIAYFNMEVSLFEMFWLLPLLTLIPLFLFFSFKLLVFLLLRRDGVTNLLLRQSKHFFSFLAIMLSAP